MIGLQNGSFSEFAYLGDLSIYSLEELSVLLHQYKKEERVEGQINYVKWSNKHSVYIFEYNLAGKF